MSAIQEGLYYTKEHEWVQVDGDTATVGISDHAQDLLTDIVFVELPNTGDRVEKEKPACVVESVKSVSDVYAPISGEISDVNAELEGAPELVNTLVAFPNGQLFSIFIASSKFFTRTMDRTGPKISFL